MNAQKYHIDDRRVALWGDSSGGHTAVMAGITAERELDTELYSDFSCRVQCIADWYGPVDIASMNAAPSTQDHTGPDSPEGCLIGGRNVLENPELAAATVPMHYLRPGVQIPPILILHGSRDHLVPFRQSCMLYEALKKQGREVQMYKLEGAYHGFGGFHSEEAIQLTLDFIVKHIG